MKNRVIFKNLDEVYHALDDMKIKSFIPHPSGSWSLYENLVHCSQAIEFSIHGFPKQHSWLFQHTVGKLAFHVFSTRGYMWHRTSEGIPNAPVIIPSEDFASGITRLQKAIIDFDEFKGDVQPHFTYGRLSKRNLDRANAMHVANHWQLFDLHELITIG